MNGISDCCGARVKFLEDASGVPELTCKQCFCAVSIETLFMQEGESNV